MSGVLKSRRAFRRRRHENRLARDLSVRGADLEPPVEPPQCPLRPGPEEIRGREADVQGVPALPDERMKAKEGFFLGSAVPKRHKAPGVLGLNPIVPAPGAEKLDKLLSTEKGQGRPGVQMISLRLPLEPRRSWFVGSLLMARLGIRRVSITRRDDGTIMRSVRCLRNHFCFSTPSANLGRECQTTHSVI